MLVHTLEAQFLSIFQLKVKITNWQQYHPVGETVCDWVPRGIIVQGRKHYECDTLIYMCE